MKCDQGRHRNTGLVIFVSPTLLPDALHLPYCFSTNRTIICSWPKITNCRRSHFETQSLWLFFRNFFDAKIFFCKNSIENFCLILHIIEASSSAIIAVIHKMPSGTLSKHQAGKFSFIHFTPYSLPHQNIIWFWS